MELSDSDALGALLKELQGLKEEGNRAAEKLCLARKNREEIALLKKFSADPRAKEFLRGLDNAKSNVFGQINDLTQRCKEGETDFYTILCGFLKLSIICFTEEEKEGMPRIKYFSLAEREIKTCIPDSIAWSDGKDAISALHNLRKKRIQNICGQFRSDRIWDKRQIDVVVAELATMCVGYVRKWDESAGKPRIPFKFNGELLAFIPFKEDKTSQEVYNLLKKCLPKKEVANDRNSRSR